MRTNLTIALLVAVGILGHWKEYRNRQPNAICGEDFPIFYAGAKLAGSNNLYSPAAVQQIQQRETGCTRDSAAFLRPPYFAAMLRPFTWLPLRTAFTVWRCLGLAAVIGFLALCGAQWKWALVACVWSNALAWDFDNGQDAAFLLVLVAGAVALVRRKRDFGAGLCLALCAAKFHLFVLVPLLLVRKDMRKIAAGMLAGGCALLAISFAVGGWDWPAQYVGAVTNPLIDPQPLLLSNLRGLSRGSWPLEILLDLTVVAAVGCVCRRATFPYGLSAVIGGGLLVSHHFTESDWALLIPVALIVAQESSTLAAALAVLLVSPLVGRWQQPDVVTVTLLLLVFALAYDMLSRQKSVGTTAAQPACES